MKKLVIKTVDKNLQAYDGFQYPESGPVEAPDFSNNPFIRSGLHGLLEGKGNWGYLIGQSERPKTLLIEVEEEDIIDLGGLVKFKKGNVIKVGNIVEIVNELIAAGVWEDNQRVKVNKKNDRTVINSGEHAVALSHDSNAKAVLVADYGSAVSNGNSSTAVSLGKSNEVTAIGYCSHAVGMGDFSRVRSEGDSSIAVSIQNSRVLNTAEALGDGTVACVLGSNGKAKAGKDGCIMLGYYDYVAGRFRMVVGYVGENGIEADTWYQVVENGNLEKACAY